MQKVIDWLDDHNPFNIGDGCLRFLSSGLIASAAHNINCDDAESVGTAIQQRLDEVRFTDVVTKKSEQVRTLLHLQHLPKLGNKVIAIDATNLFHRLIILIERSVDIPSYFAHELTSCPTSLFKDGIMRKADKPALGKVLKYDVQSQDWPSPRLSVFVI